MALTIRPAEAEDFGHILALNARVETETSPMDVARLGLLHDLSDYHRVAEVDGEVGGFLLALRESAAYENDNHDWFLARYAKFLYVDRIVVSPRHGGRGVGSALYRDLFAYARAQGVPRIVCEYNLEPPNPVSQAFHDRFGFREVGTQRVAGGVKRVSLQLAEV